MPVFQYFVRVRADLQKFSSGDELLKQWRMEADAAMKGIEAGVFQLWKDAAAPVVYGIVTLEASSAAEASKIFYSSALGLPMGAANQLIIDEIRPVMPYQEWAKALSS